MSIRSFSSTKVITPVDSGSVITMACRMLKNINKQILFHNERTAFIALNIARRMNLGKEYSIQNIVLLSLFHTIGFFREDIFFNSSEIDIANINLLKNDHQTESKYVFGCYYLEFMTPLKKESLALEHFFQPYNPDLEKYTFEEKIKSIIYFSAVISDYIIRNPDSALPQNLDTLSPNQFNPKVIEAFQKINVNNQLVQQIKTKNHLSPLYDYIHKIQMNDKDKNQYLKLLVYILDFKSTCTMSHSINTACYALSLGLRLKLSEESISELFVSALLHDIGKICTPQRILEAPGKLSPEEMGIMRHHVNHSKKIVQDLVSQSIIDNISRHHEKLNGHGYPRGLDKNNLTVLQRVITIADITSALNDSRSYKEKFEIDRTINIIREMATNGELDDTLCSLLISNFEDIKAELKFFRKPLQIDFSKILMKYNDYLFSTSVDILQTSHFDEISDEELIAEPIEEI